MIETSAASIFRHGVVARELNLLAECVLVRPEFFREHIVDDRNRRSAGIGRFRRVEGAPAQ